MKGRGHHLQEERLFDCYLAVRDGELLDPPVAEHLTDCDDCGTRYAELTEFMEMLSTEAATEADAVFSPERLRAQRMHIGRRLEHLGHQARVIGRCAGIRRASTPRPVRRWAAAAARRAVHRRGDGSVPRREAARAAGLRHTDHADRVRRPRKAEQTNLRPEAFESDGDFSDELAGERPCIRELTAVDADAARSKVNLR